MPWDKWGKGVDDTMKMFAGPRRNAWVGLDTIARALGIPGKIEGVDGSQVDAMVQAGRGAEVVDYCCRDVVVLRNVHRRLLGMPDLVDAWEAA